MWFRNKEFNYVCRNHYLQQYVYIYTNVWLSKKFHQLLINYFDAIYVSREYIVHCLQGISSYLSRKLIVNNRKLKNGACQSTGRYRNQKIVFQWSRYRVTLWIISFTQGWKLLIQFPPLCYFRNFASLPKHRFPIQYYVHVWQVYLQIRCHPSNIKAAQIIYQVFVRTKNYLLGKITNVALVTPVLHVHINLIALHGWCGLGYCSVTRSHTCTNDLLNLCTAVSVLYWLMYKGCFNHAIYIYTVKLFLYIANNDSALLGCYGLGYINVTRSNTCTNDLLNLYTTVSVIYLLMYKGCFNHAIFTYCETIPVYCKRASSILSPRENRRPFPHIVKRVFLKKNAWIWLQFIGDKTLPEPMLVSLPTHICVTQPQWAQ